MRGPGDILLVSCYELGHAPHGLTMPASFLRRAGFDPQLVDLSVETIDDARLLAARLIVISVPMHTALRMGVRLLRRVRALRATARVGFIGLYAPLNADHLRAEGADWVLGGEADAALVELARGEPPPPQSIALAKLSFPRLDRTGLPAGERYARLETASGVRHQAGYAETTRGCLDTCRHCPVPAIYRGRFFVIDRAVVLEDIAAQIAAGARHISFGDPDFLNGPGHSLAIARELHARWPEVSFDITTQVTHLLRRPEVVTELVSLNCAFVVSAFESLSDDVLAHLGKRHRRADIATVVESARAAGLVLRPTFVPFTPWTTLDDLCDLVDFIAREQLVANVSPIQLSVRLLVPPGSLLLEPDSAGSFGPLDAPTLSHRWQHDDPRVDELQRAIVARVERASERDEPAGDTFAALQQLIYRAAGRPPATAGFAEPRPVARMTEPWFC